MSSEHIVVVRFGTDAETDEDAKSTIWHLIKQPVASHENASVETIWVECHDDIALAYARYDADPRANGPDDFEAFRDAVAASGGGGGTALKASHFAIETEWALNGAGIRAVTIVLPGGSEKHMSVSRFREWLEEDAKRWREEMG